MSSMSESEKYEVCFVRCGKEKEGEVSCLKLAFDAMESHDLGPKWITQAACLKIKKKESKVFVLDPFSGEAYDHLHGLQCRIIGPLCILSCLQRGETLPKRPHPVYSVSMRGITVTCTNLDKTVREEMWEKVHLMSGTCSKDLTKSVTHLIAGEVGSKKYHVAANFGLPIMLPTWVRELWNHGQHEQIHASDTVRDEFKCPVFKGLSITVSQLSTEDRNKYKALIESNGGRYSGAMKSKDTTHLVLLEPKGDKYNFAKSWKLHCVKTDWIDDSLKAGHCMDENLYKFDDSEVSVSSEKRSTPVQGKAHEKLEVDCSAINVTLMSNLDETNQTEMSLILKARAGHSLCVLNEFNVSTLPKCGQFLDGCKIYLTGFKGAHLEKLRKIVNAGGGMRFSSFSESISHVICGEKNPEFLEQIKNSIVKPIVVTSDWLLECCKHQKLVDETPYRCMDFLSLTPTKDKAKEVEVPPKQSSTLFSKDITLADDFSEILKQYATDNNHANVSAVNCDKSLTLQEEEVSKKPLSDESKSKLDDVSRTVLPEDASSTSFPPKLDPVEPEANNTNDSVLHGSENNLFGGKLFKVVGFAPKETEILSNMILFHSGAILDSEGNSKKKYDVAIVPLIWNDFSINANAIVTNCWLQKCIEEKTVFEFNENELFTPFDIDSSIQPLKDLVISVSQYAGTERDCLMHLAEVLGAHCQEYFVRKGNAARGLLPNTHLVVATPEGSKYEASKKWKIPAVTKYWLLAAAHSKSVPPIEKYLVGMEPQRESTFFTDIVSLSSVTVADSKGANAVNESSKAANITPRKEKEETLPPPVEKVVTPSVFVAPNLRVRELIKGDRSFSAGSTTSSPDRFNDSNYRPNFDTSGMLKALVSTPSSEGSDNEGKRRKISIGDVLDHNLALALNVIHSKNTSVSSDDKMTEKGSDSNKHVLDGVVLCVSKKLGHMQLEINRIVESLGGSYRWTFDGSCTHYIFQGKTNDLSKEFREARRLRKYIVSPEWIYACKDACAHVPEGQYPHTFKSRLSLTEISTSKDYSDSSQLAANSTPVREVAVTDEPVCPEKISKERTLESRECSVDVSKELDEIIVAAKTAKAGKRRIRRNNSGCDSPITRAQRNGLGTLSPVYTNAHLHVVENDPGTSEPSQSLPITWDDPTGRMERERIAANDANNSKKSPSVENKDDDVHVIHEVNLKNLEEDIENSSFASQQNVDSCPAPQPEIVRTFMFTSLSEEEKQKYSSLIVKLGGLVSDSRSFDDKATHLVLNQPIKNEKFLASVASGKWVLHKSYIDDSFANESFLPEELYEWGGDSTRSFLLNHSETAMKLSLCPKRWRLKNQTSHCGAFHGWKVTVLADKQKANSYARILQAGGAEVFPFASIQSAEENLTHAFVEVGKNSQYKSELDFFSSRCVKCIKPEYLAFYLIWDPPPSEDQYLVLESTPSVRNSSKRREPTNSSREKKKSRLLNE